MEAEKENIHKLLHIQYKNNVTPAEAQKHQQIISPERC